MVKQNELVTEWVLKVGENSIRAMNTMESGINALSQGFEKLGHVFTGKKSLSEILFGSTSDAQNMLNTANSLKLSLKEVQEWSQAAKLTGIAPDSVLQDISHLEKYIGLTRKQVLALADTFKKASPFEREALRGFYEIGESTVTLFARGSKELENYFAKADQTILPEDKIKSLDDLEIRFNNFSLSLSNMVKSVTAEYSDTISEWMDKFEAFVKDGENVEKTLKAIKVGLMALGAAEVLNIIAATIANLAIMGKSIAAVGKMAIAMGTAFNFAFAKIGIAAVAVLGAIKGMAAAMIVFEEWGYQDKLKELGGPGTAEGQEYIRQHRERTQYLDTITGAIEKVDSFISAPVDAVTDLFSGTENDIDELVKNVAVIKDNSVAQKRENTNLLPVGSSVPTGTTGTAQSVVNNNEITIYAQGTLSEAIDASVRADEDGNLMIISNQ